MESLAICAAASAAAAACGGRRCRHAPRLFAALEADAQLLGASGRLWVLCAVPAPGDQARAVTRHMITDLEMKGTLRGAVECFNLCVNLREADSLFQECIRTFRTVSFPGSAFLHRLEVELDGVGGDCVFEQPDRVRERIGYLPENNPLPLDLRVADYLGFRAELKHLAKREAAGRVSEVMEQCGIADVAKRFIGQLSRGYRQRVGMADALLAKPELIVLDEPTSGLDPNQVRSVRRLIRELAGEHTVLISSHILSEIEMTCDRVVILHQGKLLASGDLNELMAKANAAVTAEVNAPLPSLVTETGSFTR